MKVAYDSGVRNWFDPVADPEAARGDEARRFAGLDHQHAQGPGAPCPVAEQDRARRGGQQPDPHGRRPDLRGRSRSRRTPSARPSATARQKIYLARNLKRDLLPTAAATKSMPDVEQYVRFTQRPWVGTCFFGFEEPVENMPQYGLEYGRVVGIAALLLCTDLKPEQKEPLLVNFVQVGIDLGGMVRAGHPGWTGWGGHGSGRKLPIVFAGLLLGDDELANINKSFPKVSFGEDEQTAYGDCWTGRQGGLRRAFGHRRGHRRGPHRGAAAGGLTSTRRLRSGRTGQNTSESYRRCCTSVGWVAQALALRLMHAEKAWDHDAFFDYVDRWMYEDDAAFVKTIKEATGRDHDKEWARQGQAWDAFVNEMWAKHRPTLAAPDRRLEAAARRQLLPRGHREGPEPGSLIRNHPDVCVPDGRSGEVCSGPRWRAWEGEPHRAFFHGEDLRGLLHPASARRGLSCLRENRAGLSAGDTPDPELGVASRALDDERRPLGTEVVARKTS